MTSVIVRSPQVMHGGPCFAGTPGAAQTSFGHLEAGHAAAGFSEQFPTVRREQVTGLLAELPSVTARSVVPA